MAEIGTPDRGLQGSLERWRRAIARRQLVAVARRWLIVAVTLALLLALLRAFLPVPNWLLVAAPLALLVFGVARALRRPPSVVAVARLLDHHLVLHEQVVSALEIAAATGGKGAPAIGVRPDGVLSRRIQDRATVLVGQSGRAWSVRSRVAGGEWAALVGAGAALVALLVAPLSLYAAGRGVSSARPATHAASASSAIFGAYPSASGGQAHPVLSIQVRVANAATAGAPAQHRRTAQRRGVQRLGTPSSTGHRDSAAHQNNGSRAPEGSGPPSAASKVSVPAASGTLPGQPGSATGSVQGNGSTTSGRFVTRPRSSSIASQSLRSGSGRPAGGSTAASSQQAKGTARAGAGGATRRGSSSASNNRGTGASGQGSLPQGTRNYLPYVGVQTLHGALPKPGLITGPALLSGHHAPGKSAAGRGQGSTASGSSSHSQVPTTGGRQLTLHSPYGGTAGTGPRQRAAAAPRSNQSGTVRGSAGGETGAIDYVLPDANAVAPDDRAVVGSYFAPSATH